MTEHRTQQKLSDDAVKAILLAPKYQVTAQELAKRFGVSTKTVEKIRTRSSFRAIRMARELGLIPALAQNSGIAHMFGARR